MNYLRNFDELSDAELEDFLLICGMVLVLDVELHRATCLVLTILGRLFWSYYIWSGL